MIQTGSIYRDATMKKPCILCVAITGSLPTKADNPAVPISLQEQVESTQSAFEAGATIAHCHVRNQDQPPSSAPEKFALDLIIFRHVSIKTHLTWLIGWHQK